MSDQAVQVWDSHDLETLLRLQPLGPLTFRSRYACANARGAIFGGQLLGHAMMAASMTVPADRDAVALQSTFLQSADPARAIDFEVTPLLDGKRFATRHVRGTQVATGAIPARLVLDAQITFAVELPGPTHASQSRAGNFDPESLPRIRDLPASTAAAVWSTVGYPLDSASLDLRLSDPSQGLGLDARTAALGFWLKTRATLPDDSMLQAAAFTFLSDWWISFASIGVHVRQLDRDRKRLHVASLNHGIWFHRPLRADRWLYFDVHSPCAGRGRGLSIGVIYDVDGTLVASATQESLMTPYGT